MKKILFTIVSLFIFLCAYSQEDSLTHDGLIRTYRLHLPYNYNPDSLYPFVINMHGLNSNAFEQEVYTAFDEVADSNAIIVAYPNGIGETWNVSSTTGTDDVGFISALIDTIDYTYKIDLNRVYATGMSMGGFMSYRLACELSGRIAAIASVAGLQAFFPCNPDRPVPVLQFHGTADPVVPYAGVPSTISNWVNHDLCPTTPVNTDLPDIDPNDNSTVTVSYYGLCELSTEVILYTIVNGGHTWPGATIIIGTTNQDIKASVEIWNFFKKFNLQGSTGIDLNKTDEPLDCNFYPNPVHDLAVAELAEMPDGPVEFRIFDMTGKLVLYRNAISEKRFLIDCRGLLPGFYIASLTSGGTRNHLKIIIK
jgi:polyhydroxybutyrate depolymerase